MRERCTRCTTVPNTTFDREDLYITSKSDHVLNKFKQILKKMNIEIIERSKYYIIGSEEVSKFIDILNEFETMSSIEKNELFILPQLKGKGIDATDIIFAKNLNYWISFFTNLDIIDAIKNNHIKTFFQPIFHNKTLKIYGYEALSRAYDMEGRTIAADRLFKAAKELDLAFNLDRQCRIKSIKSAAKLEDFKGKLFINFIPTVIYDPKVCLKTTDEAIANTHIRPENIIFEVVESDFVEDYNHLANILNHYRAKGYSTALDDVGAGFSTMANYEILKTDYIKLDLEMIRNIQKSKSKQLHLEKILDIKREEGFKIIAEGVETKEEYEYLRGKDIEYIQGYYFGKPVEL